MNSAPISQTWDASAYAKHGRFVADLAGDVLALLHPRAGERILDVGCGDGALTEQIAGSGAVPVGIDSSAAMVRAAGARNLDVREVSVTDLPFTREFDAAFSNAALHWVPASQQHLALARIHASLKPGARFVAEMGGHGNIASIRVALSAVLEPLGIDSEAAAASFYPTPAIYRTLLQQAGFDVTSIELVPRPTALPGGMSGMHLWLQTFRNGVFDRLQPGDRTLAINRVVELLQPVLSDTNGSWIADYVRLRFRVHRPGEPRETNGETPR